jgi:hypothetical protein
MKDVFFQDGFCTCKNHRMIPYPMSMRCHKRCFGADCINQVLFQAACDFLQMDDGYADARFQRSAYEYNMPLVMNAAVMAANRVVYLKTDPAEVAVVCQTKETSLEVLRFFRLKDQTPSLLLISIYWMEGKKLYLLGDESDDLFFVQPKVPVMA